MKFIKVCACLICAILVIALTSCGLFNKVYKVTLDYNDGSGITESLTLKSKEDRSLPRKIVDDKIVEGWYSNPECTVKYDEENSDDITVYAKWRSLNETAFTADSSEVVRGEHVIVKTDDNITIAGKNIKIKETCYIFEIIGNEFYVSDFNIYIENRKDDLTIKFTNFLGKGNGENVISSYSDNFVLNIENSGRSEIRCLNENATAIKISKLNIFGEGVLNIIGGNGSNGSGGQSGAEGNDGESGKSGYKGGTGIICSKLTVKNLELIVKGGKGGNGGNGGNGNNSNFSWYKNGGNGGDGGTGGTGVSAEYVELNDCHVLFEGGAGGNGGAGGRGGGEKKNTAGYGGNGGDGGTGGVGVRYVELINNNCVEKFVGGAGGNGGAKGISERKESDFWNQSYDKNGAPGGKGSQGEMEKQYTIEVPKEKKWFSCNCD